MKQIFLMQQIKFEMLEEILEKRNLFLFSLAYLKWKVISRNENTLLKQVKIPVVLMRRDDADKLLALFD